MKVVGRAECRKCNGFCNLARAWGGGAADGFVRPALLFIMRSGSAASDLFGLFDQHFGLTDRGVVDQPAVQ